MAAWCADRGMTDYVYAPKDDPKHRERWRDPYDADELAGFERFAAEAKPGLGLRDLARPQHGVRRVRRPSCPRREGRPGGGGRSRARGPRPRRHPLRRRSPGRGARPCHDVVGRSPGGARRPRPRPDGVRGHPAVAPARGARPGRAVERADRLDRSCRRQRHHHRRRCRGPRRLARGTPPTALGQLSRQRRGDGRPPVRRAAAGPRARAGRRVQWLPGQPDGAGARLAAPAGVDRRLPARRRSGAGLARHRRRPGVAQLCVRLRHGRSA